MWKWKKIWITNQMNLERITSENEWISWGWGRFGGWGGATHKHRNKWITNEFVQLHTTMKWIEWIGWGNESCERNRVRIKELYVKPVGPGCGGRGEVSHIRINSMLRMLWLNFMSLIETPWCDESLKLSFPSRTIWFIWFHPICSDPKWLVACLRF